VIIPVRDDGDGLAECLLGLSRQDQAAPFEVVVVDNNSRESPSGVVEQFPWARLVAEPRPGSYVARNTGVAESRSQVLAFIDSDCRPAPDWLALGLARLREAGEAAFVAGAVQISVRDPEAPSAAEIYDLMTAFRQEHYLRRYSFSGAGNLWVRREVFEQVGPFDARLISSGDREWGQRAHAAGIPGIYAPDVRVTHPARTSVAELRRKVHRLQVGEHQLRRLRNQPDFDASFLKHLARPPIRTMIRSLPRVEPATPWSKARYMAVALFLHYLHAFERLRVVLGTR
jgi:glycosyltransferase involved in cell wall biosynthesis